MGRLSVRGRARLLAGSLFALCAVLLVLPRLVPLGLGFTVPAVGLIGFLSLGPYSLLAGYFAVQLRARPAPAPSLGSSTHWAMSPDCWRDRRLGGCSTGVAMPSDFMSSLESVWFRP